MFLEVHKDTPQATVKNPPLSFVVQSITEMSR